MFRNFIKTAWRHLKKNTVFSGITIFGLATGLCCFMLVAAFVFSELHYDRYPDKASQVYRLNLSVTGNDNVVVYPSVDVAVGSGMKDAFPEIEACTRFAKTADFVQYGDRRFKEERLAYADSNLLSFFSIPFIRGNRSTALKEPNSVVITKALATKYFGKEEPLGKTLIIGLTNKAYEISGVIDKIPEESHFHFDAFISASTFPVKNLTWTNLGSFTYLRLKASADPKKLEAKFPQLVAQYVVPEIKRDMGISMTEAQKSVNTFLFSLQPLTDIHLYANSKYELEPGGDIHYVYFFSALAVFILLLACINFTNLSTAMATRRAREAGIRKVIGSQKKQLVIQFLSESLLYTLFALVLAYSLAYLLLPYFNRLSGKHITFGFFIQPLVLSGMLTVSFLSGLLAGWHPAFFLSAFNTIKVLKGNSLFGNEKKPLRNSLIVFQFFVSIALIMATMVVYRQLQYMQNKKSGYDKEQVVFLPDARLLGENQKAFQQQLLKDRRVVASSMSRSAPGCAYMGGTQIYPKNEESKGMDIHTNIYRVDENYVTTLSIPVIRGRNFMPGFSNDSQSVLINEAAVKDLGWTNDNAVGKTILRSGQHELKVLGVVQNFNYASLKQRVAPLMMMLGNNSGGLILKTNTTDMAGFLQYLEKQWKAFNPTGPLVFYFLDEQYASLYSSEQRIREIFTGFALLAIIIASLGLFGLSSFVIRQRAKEIGIRKVMGASLSNILVLVSREFLLLVGIAFIIAVPVAWWGMYNWLQNFAYRTTITFPVALIAGGIALLIAVCTLSFQALKAALANPVKAIHTE